MIFYIYNLLSTKNYILGVSVLFSLVFTFEDTGKYRRELDSIYYRIEGSLLEKNDVEYLKSQAEEVLSGINYLLKNSNELILSDREKLSILKKETENVISFFYMIDNTSGLLENIEFYRIVKKVGGIITSIPSNNTNVQVIKIQIGDYHALFLENLTKSTSFKVSYEFLDRKYNVLTRSGEMGLIRRNVRHIANSRENENFHQLKFKSIVCEIIDFPL
jgi:hypothetical protein